MNNNYDNMYDMIIVGGGPAGLSAAIYMARAKYKTLVIEKEKFGGQITITSEVVNYPGIFNTSGAELTDNMQKQAEHFGAEFKLSEVLEMDLSQDIKTIKTTSGEYKSLGVILALGASPRKVGFEGEEEFAGRGVAYCATCDGEFFNNMPIYVVGGGFAAVEESIFLTKYASNIEMIVRGEEFSCAKSISDELNHESKISVNFNTEVVSVSGENSLNKIVLRDKLTGEITEKNYDKGFGVFVFAGYIPNTSWLSSDVELHKGYIVTDEKKQTNIPGVYGAGDVCIKDLRQVVTAVSDGATAATCAEKYISSIRSKLNIPVFEVTQKEVQNNAPKAHTNSSNDVSDKFIDDDMKAQLAPIFDKFSSKVIINAVLDNSELGNELKGFMEELKTLNNKVQCRISTPSNNEVTPYLEILHENEESSGIKYFTMPGGHEFNSFILAMYNVAGPGREIGESDLTRIKNIKDKLDIKVLMSLSCTMCPEVVTSTQKIASLNENISACAIDINHFQEIKEKYNVMSVPCMIINNEKVHFGKKNITQILDLLEN
ncbi:MAG: FAD-dependent oxidoreductase [Peptostreptococcaceae bacterium]